MIFSPNTGNKLSFSQKIALRKYQEALETVKRDKNISELKILNADFQTGGCNRVGLKVIWTTFMTSMLLVMLTWLFRV